MYGRCLVYPLEMSLSPHQNAIKMATGSVNYVLRDT